MSNATAPVTSQTADNMIDRRGSKSRGHEKTPSPEISETAIAFDYRSPAELFPTRSRKPRRTPVTYKRFDTAAAAVRFAIEELPSDLLLGAYLQVEEERFGSEGIRKLYDSERYPLKRRAVSRP